MFVVATQAFSVSLQPVFVDWQYDSWGDELFVTVQSYSIVANSATDYDVQLTLANSGGSDLTRTVRIELLDINGARVAITGQSNTDPDDDSQWLVVEEAVVIGAGSTAPTSVHSFIDAKVEAVVAGGGYFMVYTDEGSQIWTDGAYVNAEKIHTDIQIPDYAVTLIIFPTDFSPVAAAWTNPTYAYDDTPATFAISTSTNIVDGITFTYLSAEVTTAPVVVDVTVELVITWQSKLQKQDDYFVSVVVGAETLSTTTINSDTGTSGSPVTVTLSNVPGPGGDGWQEAEILNVQIEITGVNNGGADTLKANEIYEVYITFNP